MAKKRVTGRFYIFLLLVAAILLFAFRGSLFETSEYAVVMAGVSSDKRTADAVLIRDEAVYASKQVSRVTHIATERTLVNQGDDICYIYSLEYSEKLIKDLDTLRVNIQAYHKSIMDNILDTQLEVLDLTVNQKALELKKLVNRTVNGNLLKLVQQLEQTMLDRQNYMRQNMRSDQRLIKYYDEETQKINTISGWRSTETASREGIISFYLDGYEDALKTENLSALTIDEMRTVLAKGSLSAYSTRGYTNVFRIVNQNQWYVVLIVNDPDWNPVVGQRYSIVMSGYEDLVYEGVVERMQKSGSTVMAQLSVTDPIGPLIYFRSGKASLGTDLSGLLVTVRAIDIQSGQTGVWLSDNAGGTFIPVEILSNDGTNALILPLVDGALSAGSRVIVK